MRAMEYSSTHYEKARHYQGSKILQMKIWNFWKRKNQFWIKFNDVSSLCKLLGGPGRNKVIISIYSIRVFFLKKGNLLWFSWFLHYLNFPISGMIIGVLKNYVQFIVFFSNIAEILKNRKKHAIFDCKPWLTPS